MLLPMTFPMTRPGLPFAPAKRLMTSSGREVPKETTVSPITNSEMLSCRAIEDAPRTSQSAPFTRRARPATRMKYLSTLTFPISIRRCFFLERAEHNTGLVWTVYPERGAWCCAVGRHLALVNDVRLSRSHEMYESRGVIHGYHYSLEACNIHALVYILLGLNRGGISCECIYLTCVASAGGLYENS